MYSVLHDMLMESMFDIILLTYSALLSFLAVWFLIYLAVWSEIWPSGFLFIRPSGFGRMYKSGLVVITVASPIDIFAMTDCRNGFRYFTKLRPFLYRLPTLQKIDSDWLFDILNIADEAQC